MALTTDDFADVQSALWKAHSKWYNIGVRLQLSITDLDAIDHESRLDLDGKFRRMITSWLECGQRRTWRALGEALTYHTVNLPELAQQIANYGSNKSQNYSVQYMYVFWL